VWEVQGQPILTDAWADDFPGFKAVAPLISSHPLDAQWLLITASAGNGRSMIYQYAIFDTANGQISVTSRFFLFLQPSLGA
jgi:hypothetical protein